MIATPFIPDRLAAGHVIAGIYKLDVTARKKLLKGVFSAIASFPFLQVTRA